MERKTRIKLTIFILFFSFRKKFQLSASKHAYPSGPNPDIAYPIFYPQEEIFSTFETGELKAII